LASFCHLDSVDGFTPIRAANRSADSPLFDHCSSKTGRFDATYLFRTPLMQRM
jgi:hypothetical protein